MHSDQRRQQIRSLQSASPILLHEPCRPNASDSSRFVQLFGSLKVHRITVEMVRTYVADRKAANVANKTINLELGVLRGVMKRAKLWHHFSDEIKPLPVHTKIGRAMTLDEKLRLAKTAAMKPE